MDPVRTLREHAEMTQKELAHAAGTSQPTIASYESGRKSPTLRTMKRLADAAGLHVELRVYRGLTREDRRSLAVHRAVALRLEQQPGETLARARATLHRLREAHPAAASLLREWHVLLKRPLPALLPVLTDPSEYARELRHVTPFAGVLSAGERAKVYRAFAESETDTP